MQIYAKLRARMKDLLADARQISLTADIWSKPNMVSSYLGVTAHFFGSNNKRNRMVLAIKPMEKRHTGAHILEVLLSILNEWSINPEKVLKIVTDNGANMLKGTVSLVHDLLPLGH